MNITLDTSTFKPVEWSQLIAPLLKYDKDYDLYAEKLEKVAEDYGNLSSVGLNDKYAELLNLFNDDLHRATDLFYKSNLNQSGNMLNKLFLTSKRDISKIKKGIENYNADIDKITSLGGDAIVGNELDINNYIDGRKAPIQYQSRKDVVAGSAAYFAGLNLAQQLLSDPTFSSILKDQYLLEIRKGINPREAMSSALSSLQSTTYGTQVSELQKHMKNYMDSLGVDNYSDAAQRLIWSAIGTGLMASMKDTRELRDDKSVQLAATRTSTAGQSISNLIAKMLADYYNEHGWSPSTSSRNGTTGLNAAALKAAIIEANNEAHDTLIKAKKTPAGEQQIWTSGGKYYKWRYDYKQGDYVMDTVTSNEKEDYLKNNPGTVIGSIAIPKPSFEGKNTIPDGTDTEERDPNAE